jgi:sigma-B regulation protein RsbU (phosphoserine phosphatase)
MSYSGFLSGAVVSGVATKAAVRPLDAATTPLKVDPYVSRASYQELESKYAALQNEHAVLQNAIAEAERVYRYLCAPHLIRHGNFEIASEVFAVRHLPGDFFTLQEVGGYLLLALGDISGKGLSAGMWTTLLVGLLRRHAIKSHDPATIVARVNEDLCQMSSIMPLTSLFLARLDPFTGQLDYCNAGHPPAFLLRSSGKIDSLTEGGPLLGVIPEISYDADRIELSDGDVLLAYSDGVNETRNGADEEFGYRRLETHLRSSQKSSADMILFSLLGAVQSFAGASQLADDISVVVVRGATNRLPLT